MNRDFINQMKALVKPGRLTAEQGNALIEEAQAILVALP